MSTSATSAPPVEQGQIVRLRHKAWAVTSVQRSGRKGDYVHRVGLECLSDDALGHEIHVIWEREVAPVALESSSLPLPDRVDPPEVLDAFLRALRWTSSSLAVGDVLQAPFRGGVQIEKYQLPPVIRARQMPRVRLLIADDVGLGKTIEAGLIVQELIHSHRASRMLVICPAHLKQKWVDEMAEKFGLEFRIIERDTVVQMRKDFGPTINPWASFPRLVTSIDYLKTEHPKRLFDELCLRRSQENAASKPWDLMILDEAHNVAPSGRKNYVRDSDRTTMIRGITEQFEHKVFLTATPHNGYRESFTGMLEILDNLRFSRGTDLDQQQLDAVRIRRLKQHIKNEDGTPRFPPRVVLPRDDQKDPELYVELSESGTEVFDLLAKYTESRLAAADKRTKHATEFVLTLLKKRALSSPLALRESLVKHTETIGVRDKLSIGDSLFRSLESREAEDFSDDEEKDQAADAATAAASNLLVKLSPEEETWLQRLAECLKPYGEDTFVEPDEKANALISWIEAKLREGSDWNGERVIIFTEYKHTLEYLYLVLERAGYGDAVERIYGGMPDKDRKRVNELFQSADAQTSIRILLATDAASEGADFQKHCRNLIHYEIPWNPVRLEQRNGRIDRHGQRADEVRVHHFVYRNQSDSEFLDRIVKKVDAIREDLGSVGAVIAEDVRLRSLGGKVDIDDIGKSPTTERARAELGVSGDSEHDAGAMVEVLAKARAALGITDESQLDLLEQALCLEGLSGAVERRDGGRFVLRELPRAWRECGRYLSKDDLDRPLTFDREDARDHDELTVVHLDHPLMRRAAATFRVQMWSDGQDGLARATVTSVPGLQRVSVRAWGRLVLLGPEHNRLHEGLVHCDLQVGSGGLTASNHTWDELGSVVGDIAAKAARATVAPHLEQVTELLKEAGYREAEVMEAVLTKRGNEAEKHARGLASDRLQAIRKAIKERDQEQSDQQMLLFGEEERDQLVKDRAWLDERVKQLEQERDTEPKRLRKLYRVKDRRVYPVAMQIFVPEGK